MQNAEKLSITLPAEMVRVIRAKVESGFYGSNSEVIREAIRCWLEREQHFATLTTALERGIEDADSGQVVDSNQLRKSLLTKLNGGQRNTP